MAARKKSQQLKQIQGTLRPGRDSKNAPVSSKELGFAPSVMTDEQKETWQEISERLPEGVATDANRISFEIQIRLVCKMRSGEISGTETTALMRLFAAYRMTPATRDSITIVPKKKGPGRWGKHPLS